MKIAKAILSTILLIAAMAVWAAGQSTEFTYQGKLNDGAVPANANYDFEFLLYSAASGGTQIGSTNTRNTVAVVGGIFSVVLDFGTGFPGADRYLEIRVRPTGGSGITILAPRQRVNSTPYGIRSQSAGMADTATNAAQLGGVAASQYVQTGDPRLSDARNPLPGSSNYIRNGTTEQTGSFNISGNASIGGNAVIDGSVFANGTVRGTTLSGNQVDMGGVRAFLAEAGPANTFAGSFSGNENTTGSLNAFFGTRSGLENTTGNTNSFFGYVSGGGTTTGSDNVFVGGNAGFGNTTGSKNTFVGRSAGDHNTIGSNNTAIGYASDVPSGNLSFATTIGAGSVATETDSVTLGRSADIVYVPGFLRLTQLGGAGSTALCRNNANTIGTCSSSLRYKTNIGRFGLGLDLVRGLQPITFDWKDGGMHDLGLGAEDVAAIEPLLATYNDKGQVEGVKYDRIGVVLINAVKEQQKTIEDQQAQINALRALVCASNKDAGICRER